MRISDWSSDVCSSDLATAREDAVHVADHRCDPAHIEILAARPGLARQQFVDVLLHRRIPVALVRHVDCEFLGVFRNLHVACGQQERTQFAVERERVHATADRRSEEHTSELQPLMRISSAVYCLKKNKQTTKKITQNHIKKHETQIHQHKHRLTDQAVSSSNTMKKDL